MAPWSDNPRVATRVGLIVLAGGGIIAGIGSLIRDLSSDGTADWTYLLDTLGLILALVGAGYDFKTQLRFGGHDQVATRRRGAFLLMAGLIGTIGGCWLLGWVFTGDSLAVLRALIASGLTAGIGAAVDGFLHLGWFGSGDYLDRRIAQRSQE
jgi:hypothetical protein